MSVIVILDDRATNRKIFSKLAASIEAGAEVPFEVGQETARGPAVLYRYRSLSARFVRERFAELERIAQEVGRSMPQVAINWAANRPGIASVLLGASRSTQLEDNLQALDFTLPAELRRRLDAVSEPPAPYPHSYLQAVREMLSNGSMAGSKPPNYATGEPA